MTIFQNELKMERQSSPQIFVRNDRIDTKSSSAAAKLNQISVRRLLTLLIGFVGREWVQVLSLND